MGKQKYYIKATLDKGQSGYDLTTFYHEGENIHPDPDLSNLVCGKGIHVAKTLSDALSYVLNATEFYLAIPGRILGEDSTKIRTDRVTLFKIPNNLYDEYWEKVKPIDDEYQAKLKLIDDEYQPKLKPIDDEYWEKLKPISDEYWEKLKLISDEYWEKVKLIDDEYQPKLKPINDEYWEKVKLIDDEYWEKREAIDKQFIKDARKIKSKKEVIVNYAH